MQEQRRQLENVLLNTPLSKLKADGSVLTDLDAHPEGRLYGELLWRVQPAAGGELPAHKFRGGDSIALRVDARGGDTSRGGRPPSVDATLLEVHRDHLMVTLPAAAAQQLAERPSGASLRVEVTGQEATARRQIAALDRLEVLDGPKRRGAGAVRAILLDSPQAKRLAAEPPEWMQQPSWREGARELLQQLSNVNDSQRAAVANALGRTYTLWQGPPGTGKTRTLLSFLELMCRLSAAPTARQQLGPMLAVADTNAAADNLLAGLLSRGVAAVRVGQPAKVRPELRHACLDAQAERAPAGQQAARLRDQAAQALGRAAQALQQGVISPAEWRQAKRESDRMWGRADAALGDAAGSVLAGCRVVVGTCTSAGEARLAELRFRVVVLDEATQATEASSLVPLVKGAECVVMAGDHKQLPPTIVSRQALQ